MSWSGVRRERKRYEGRGELVALLLLGALIFSPALLSPLFLDDFLQGAMVDGVFPARRGPFDLYDFVADDDRAAMFENGFLPWWSDAHLTLRFFRPLASFLLYAEHRLFDHAALPMHVVSFLWWVFAVLGARALFRETLSPRASRLATWIFALAPCHALPLGWVANREALLSLTFGVFGLSYFRRWRSARATRDGLLSCGLFLLAFFSGGEYALGFGGYVLAYDVAARGEALDRRATGWLPFVTAALAYLVLRSALGYGTLGSGFYSDPIHQPLAFVTNAPIRLASLLGAGWLTFDVLFWRIRELPSRLLVPVLVGFGGLLVVHLRRVRGTFDDAERFSSKWLFFGSSLALVPVLAVAPATRLLGIAMIGIAGFVGILLEKSWFPSEASAEGIPSSSSSSLFVLLLGFAHLVHGPGTAFLTGLHQRKSAIDFRRRVDALRGTTEPPALGDVGVVRGLASSYFMPFAMRDEKGRLPRWRVLSQGGHVLAQRRDARTLDLITAPDRGIFPSGEANLYRDERNPLRAGDEVQLPGMRVKILDVTSAGPRVVRFTFDDDPGALSWISDDYERVRRVTLPPAGFGAPFDPRTIDE